MTGPASPLTLVTGGTGFVGRQVLHVLAKEGIPVRLVARAGRARALDRMRFESVLLTEDLFAESAGWWADACRRVDTLIHVAWYAVPGRYLVAPENLDCLVGTLALAKGAAAAGVRRVVGIGTCFEYDLAPGRVAPGRVAVDTPLRPASPYAAAKAAAYLALSRWLPERGVELAWCRLFYLYGQGENPNRLVGHIRARLAAGELAELTAGTQVRDYMDVADAARRIVEVARGGEQGAVNVCSGVPITVRALAERIADEYGRRDLLRFGARPENAAEPPVVVGVP